MSAPEDVEGLARRRSEARRARDWDTADALRAQLEAAGWKVIDRGTDYQLEPAQPPDVVEDGVVRYGSSAAVPSRLAEPHSGSASVVVTVTDEGSLRRTLDALAAHPPGDVQVIAVTDLAPGGAHEAALAGRHPLEVVWTARRFPPGAAVNAGVRRTTAPVIVVLDPGVDVRGDFTSPVISALEDASVGVTGLWPLASRDMRGFAPVDPGTPAATTPVALDGRCIAFRRADYLARGPLDERFGTHRALHVWWSLILRDEGGGRSPRRAVVPHELPIVAGEDVRDADLGDAQGARLGRRDSYRILDRFGQRLDLLSTAG